METQKLTEPNTRRILMGNEAMAWGLLEAGVTVATSYPGTPASEILASVAAFAREMDYAVHAEWSLNEKVAYEVALANAMAGRRSAVAMKQVGLNVASDPFLRSAYLGVTGGLVAIVADDPGPHSSQTEQDSRFFAMFAKVPALDPSSPREAREMVALAFALSEQYEIPVLIRPTTRICHARQDLELTKPQPVAQPALFTKDPRRWCATPQFLRDLHHQLNEKIAAIANGPRFAPRLTPGDGSISSTAIVASGAAFAHTWDLLDSLGLSGRIELYQIPLPYPLAPAFQARLADEYRRVLVLEETYPVIEMQLGKAPVFGRVTGLVPKEGELTPEVIRQALENFLDLPQRTAFPVPAGGATRPTLCAGCAHRAAFYAIKETFPEGIYPSDIGCYTLGMNLGAVDTCLCMGAGIAMAAGFYQAYADSHGQFPTIAATIGDSTFFHAGLPPLMNAVVQGARFILVILDNGTTAMTGHQPTPASGLTASGAPAARLDMEALVRACCVRFLKVADPYDLPAFTGILKEADAFARQEQGGVAVIIARHPCILDRTARKTQDALTMEVTADCIGCDHCLDEFECPGLARDEADGRARIDASRCIGCGVCIHVCPHGAIVGVEREEI